MKILGIDTSHKIASMALLNDGKIDLIEKNTNLSHSESILPLCEEILNKNQLKVKDIDAFAVIVGPGSFTGLRIGIAVAKGFALSADKELVGISALEAVAYGAETEGKICSLIKARENDYFYGVYQKEKGITSKIEEESSGDLKEVKKSFDNEKINFEEALPNASQAVVLAQIKIEKGEHTDIHEVNPVYLKLSQAERMKLKENKQN